MTNSIKVLFYRTILRSVNQNKKQPLSNVKIRIEWQGLALRYWEIFDLVGQESKVISKHAEQISDAQKIRCALTMVEDQRLRSRLAKVFFARFAFLERMLSVERYSDRN